MGDFTRLLDRTHDAKLRPAGHQLKNGAILETSATYTYDPTGRLHTVGDGTNTFTYNYAANSHLLHTLTGPAHTVTNTWDTTRDALLVKENKAGGNVIYRYEYSVNEIGQRTGVATSGSAFAAPPSIGWEYNARGEVTGAAHSDPLKSRFYDYDPIGNRKKSRTGTATDSGGELTTYVSNPLNQYTAVSTVSPSYDADGNQLQGPFPADPSKTAGYLWDSENRLLEASSDGTTVASYRYDPFGRRIAKTASGTTTLFLYDGWNLIAEYSRSAGVPPEMARTLLWGSDLSGGFQGAGGVGGLLSTMIHGSSSADSFHPLYDGNGNISEYLDDSGTVAAHFEYDPFGKLTVNTDSSGQFPIRFSTKFQDFETRLSYYGYRFYDPIHGRWVSRDPIQERGGINLYGFLKDDGINAVDGLGLKSWARTKFWEINIAIPLVGQWIPYPECECDALMDQWNDVVDTLNQLEKLKQNVEDGVSELGDGLYKLDFKPIGTLGAGGHLKAPPDASKYDKLKIDYRNQIISDFESFWGNPAGWGSAAKELEMRVATKDPQLGDVIDAPTAKAYSDAMIDRMTDFREMLEEEIMEECD